MNLLRTHITSGPKPDLLTRNACKKRKGSVAIDSVTKHKLAPFLTPTSFAVSSHVP